MPSHRSAASAFASADVLPVAWYMRTSATASHITLSLLPRSPGTQVWAVAASVRKVGYPHTANVGTTGANCSLTSGKPRNGRLPGDDIDDPPGNDNRPLDVQVRRQPRELRVGEHGPLGLLAVRA